MCLNMSDWSLSGWICRIWWRNLTDSTGRVSFHRPAAANGLAQRTVTVTWPKPGKPTGTLQSEQGGVVAMVYTSMWLRRSKLQQHLEHAEHLYFNVRPTGFNSRLEPQCLWTFTMFRYNQFIYFCLKEQLLIHYIRIIHLTTQKKIIIKKLLNLPSRN